ncbi:MAG: RNA polymerase factor sigma-54 [Thermodesulfobacteriota bacterium]
MLELRQQLKLSQQLVMTPQLQQAIKLLQLSRLELVDTVTQEVEQNPVLEDETPVLTIADGDNKVAAAPDQAAPEPGDQTSDVKLDNSSLSEINWSDYANEYEPVSSYRPREAGDEAPSRLDILTAKPDLISHLRWQLSFVDLGEEEEEVAFYVLGNMNREGFIELSDEEIASLNECDLDLVRGVVDEIQGLDPAGVGAHNVQESLLLQLDRLGLAQALASTIVRDHLSLLETKNFAAIAKKARRPVSEVVEAVQVIMGLDPHPGWAYSAEEPHYITPDVYVQKEDGEYVILLNDDGLPKLKINSYYRQILQNKDSGSAKTREYIQEKLRSAAWLIKSIQQRQQTIYRVVESILKFQYDFFEQGVAHLKPLVLRDVAEDISMHESTISRVTSNKYVHTPQGTFELKYFFTSAIERKDGGAAMSSESIKQRLRKMVKGENPDKPLSDKAIADMFATEGVKLARRTVAKYREQLGILSSKYRKCPRLK